MNSSASAGVVVAGGDRDPNLRALLGRLEERGVEAIPILVGGSAASPRLVWDVVEDRLELDGAVLDPVGVFVRHDVFTHLADRRPASSFRAMAWYAAVMGWARGRPGVSLFNRRLPGELLKPQQLRLAHELGMAIPATWVTNDMAWLGEHGTGRELVTKPVAGGDHCRELGPLLARTPQESGAAAAPALVQERLVAPDVRVYRVGERLLSFHIVSDVLDYRTSPRTRVEETEVPEEILRQVRALTDAVGLDFAAVDLKASPDTGELVFLEVNTGPMFAAFDGACDGRLCGAMIDFLLGG